MWWWAGLWACLSPAGQAALAAPAASPERTLKVQAVAAATQTSQRLALVIGNGAYREAPLGNPGNDARAIAQALERSGFTVILRTDVGLRDMMNAVRDFGTRLREGGTGVFYFAGHGMQIKGRNYLIPVGADIQREDEVAYQALDAQAVLDKMETAGNATNLMILDACRNNPFARSFRSAQQGLAQMDAPVGTLVAFATSPGSVSSDGAGSNGLYTQFLLRAMAQPGMKVEDVFKEVRRSVRKESQGKQVPWESTSLEGDFFFMPPLPVVQAPPPPPPPPPPPAAPVVSAETALDNALWDAVRDSQQAVEVQAYLKRFPAGAHAQQARQKLALLTKPTPAPAVPQPVPQPAPQPAVQVAAQASTPPAPTPAPRPQPTTAAAAMPDSPPRVSVGLAPGELFRPAPTKPATAQLPAGFPDTAPRVSVGLMPESRPDTGPAKPARAPVAINSRGISSGDRWRYQVVDKWRGEVVRNYTTAIARVGDDNHLFTAGGTRYDEWLRPVVTQDANGTRVEYTPYQPRWWEGMQPGQKQSASYQQRRIQADGSVTLIDIEATLLFKTVEKVKVPAGEFDAQRIEIASEAKGRSAAGNRWWQRWTTVWWYSPELRNFVAMEFEARDERNTLVNSQREELTGYEQRQGPLAAR